LQRHPNEQLATLLGGQIYTAAGQFARARDLYEAYVKMNPRSGIIYNNLANLYADNLGNLPKALETARKARALEPTSPSVADTLGWILYQQKDYVGALPLVEEAARNLPDNPEIQLHVGLVQRNLGNEAAAQAALRRAAQSPGTSTVKSEAQRLLAATPAAAAKAPTTEKPKQP
ncbi:MAG: tetratricopeptide repeat protein, partial [Verrucomicrobiota bacterium]